MKKKTVVILVDNKKRDLPGCALIAHHLEERFRINCELQPLEAWRSCLEAFRPGYVLFNHLTASHLAGFSNRLAEMGVLVGVLPNEGILYSKEVLAFNAGKYHHNAHIDHYFCWNGTHGEALKAQLKGFKGEICVAGVPRFDYYFEPWKKVFETPARAAGERPRILVCTNFVFAKFKEMPAHRVDKFFSPFKDRIPSYRDYRELVEVNARCRDRVFGYLNAMLDGTDCLIDLKPHPGEFQKPYMEWFKNLSTERKARVSLRLDETIFEVMPQCDLEISCETCTTALEAWILGKPTIELVFEKHPVYFHEETAQCNRLCDSPEKLPGLIERALNDPEQADQREARAKHLARWCASPSGRSSLKVAETIAKALEVRAEPRWDLINATDRRRAVKLKLKNSVGLPYGSNPWKLLLSALPGRAKNPLEAKFIRPSDVRLWREKLIAASRRAQDIQAATGVDHIKTKESKS